MVSTFGYQWQSFEELVAPLEMPFFFVPGNHDVTNPVQREIWAGRFGPSVVEALVAHAGKQRRLRNLLQMSCHGTEGERNDNLAASRGSVVQAAWPVPFISRFADVDDQLS